MQPNSRRPQGSNGVTPEIEGVVVERFLTGGETVEEIAREFGVPEAGVRASIRRPGAEDPELRDDEPVDADANGGPEADGPAEAEPAPV
jgi:transposase-like protein